MAALRFSGRSRSDRWIEPTRSNASPARRFARRVAPLHDASQARSGASHEVWFPSALAGHAVLARRASSGHPASALGGLAFNPSELTPGLSPRPCGFSCRAPALPLRAPPAVGHSPRDSSSAAFRAHSGLVVAWPVPSSDPPDLDLPVRVRFSAPEFPAALLGFSPFAVLLLPAGVGPLPAHEPTCRFARLHRDNFRRGTGFPFRFDHAGRGGRSQGLAAAPGLWPRGQAVPVTSHGGRCAPTADRVTGLDCPGFLSVPLSGMPDVFSDGLNRLRRARAVTSPCGPPVPGIRFRTLSAHGLSIATRGNALYRRNRRRASLLAMCPSAS